MAMRSQIDTSMYRAPERISLGEIIDVVNGVADFASAFKDRRKKLRDEKDLDYINEVIGKYMQGYAGNDPADLQQRRQGAINEVLQSRPELNRHTSTMQDAIEKNRFTSDENALKLQSDQVALDNDKEVYKKNQRANIDDETMGKFKRIDQFTTGMVDVDDQTGYDFYRSTFNDGNKLNIPHESYEDFLRDPKMKYYRDMIEQKKQAKLTTAERDIEDRDLLVREKEAGIGKTGAEAKYKGAQAADLYSQMKKRQWDMDNPKTDPSKIKFGSLAGFNAPETLSYAGMAMGQFSKMKQLIDSGDAKFYERGALGSFTNPEFKKTLDFLSNYIGRQDSGAAINKDEWKTFKNLIADRNLMMTPEGRQQVSNLLGEYIGRTYNMGVFQTKGNENWYDDYEVMSGMAKQKYGGPGPVTKGPKPGDMEDGYVFRGGDPADTINWELVK